MSRMSMQERYLHDPVFNQLVDSLEAMIDRLQATPTEIREAAMLAVLHYEERQMVPRWRVGKALGDALASAEAAQERRTP